MEGEDGFEKEAYVMAMRAMNLPRENLQYVKTNVKFVVLHMYSPMMFRIF